MSLDSKRSLQQNKLYHEYAGQLKAHSVIKIYDGRFEQHGISNPIVFRPSAFSIDNFREILKACDISYPKDHKSRPLSSARVTVEQMNSHIMFLECLLSEY